MWVENYGVFTTELRLWVLRSCLLHNEPIELLSIVSAGAGLRSTSVVRIRLSE